MKSFYVTTPIYYVNDAPHIGHAYSTVAADVLARYHQLRGQKTRFLTGTDEHGQKLERAAQAKGIDTQAFVDQMAPPFEKVATELTCQIDDFIRTTQPRHKEKVQKLWNMLVESGDIYEGEYEDWYCVGCESFKTERDLLEGNLCPDHKKPVEKIKETSYFFRLSNYTDRLLKFYEDNPKFVQPEGRFNEVKAFVKENLRDLSISRTSFSWGVPVPGNDKHVMYVWLDALTNYISALGGPAAEGESPLFDEFWPKKDASGERTADVVHIVGKDILRFHAIYWPAFLLSAGIEPPTQVWAHGWLTVNGEKMSKSLGNFIPPGPLVEAFGPDVVRYYLMRDVGFGQDGDFSHQSLLDRYHGELGNGLGNLLNRMVASIVKKSLNGKVRKFTRDELEEMDVELLDVATRASTDTAAQLDNVAPHRALEAAWELVGATNRYVDRTEPWALAKKGETDRLEQVSFTVLESLRILSILLWPVLPGKCDELRAQLGLGKLTPEAGTDSWPTVLSGPETGFATDPGNALFPRFDAEQQKSLLETLMPKAPATEAAATEKEGRHDVTDPLAHIEFDDFMKVELRLGLIKEAEKVPKSSKLLKLQIDTGDLDEAGQPTLRQVLAGIGKHYKAEEMVGKRVVVVCNLAPRKMMGLESQGMVLAASDDDGLSVLGVDKGILPGVRVS